MSTKNTGTIWWAGFASHMAVSSLIMDYRGKEDMIRQIAWNWIDPRYTVPGALLLLWYAWRKCRKAEKAIDATTFELVKPSPWSRHSAHRAFTRKQHTTK